MLNAEQREFVTTGLSPEMWTKILGEDAYYDFSRTLVPNYSTV